MDEANKPTSKPTDYLGKTVTVQIDRPLRSKHPKHDLIYELNYGFIPDTTSPDGEELDAYVIGVDHPIESFQGKCIAVIHRSNDNDDKLVVVPEAYELTDEDILRATHFQEQYFNPVILR